MTPSEMGVYGTLQNWSPYGIWRGTAHMFAERYFFPGKYRSVARALNNLKDPLGLVLFEQPGERDKRHRPYFLNKYRVRFGKLWGYELNAQESMALNKAVYDWPTSNTEVREGLGWSIDGGNTIRGISTKADTRSAHKSYAECPQIMQEGPTNLQEGPTNHTVSAHKPYGNPPQTCGKAPQTACLIGSKKEESLEVFRRVIVTADEHQGGPAVPALCFGALTIEDLQLANDRFLLQPTTPDSPVPVFLYAPEPEPEYPEEITSDFDAEEELEEHFPDEDDDPVSISEGDMDA